MPAPSTNSIAEQELPHGEVPGGVNTLIAAAVSAVRTFLDGLMRIFVL